MGMLQYHRRSKGPCQVAHLVTSVPPNADDRLVRPSALTKHVQVMATQNENPFIRDGHEVRSQISHLNQTPFL
jgi:hypothetical protein